MPWEMELMGPKMNELGFYILYASLGGEVEVHPDDQRLHSSSRCANQPSYHQTNVPTSCGIIDAEQEVAREFTCMSSMSTAHA